MVSSRYRLLCQTFVGVSATGDANRNHNEQTTKPTQTAVPHTSCNWQREPGLSCGWSTDIDTKSGSAYVRYVHAHKQARTHARGAYVRTYVLAYGMVEVFAAPNQRFKCMCVCKLVCMPTTPISEECFLKSAECTTVVVFISIWVVIRWF